MREKLFLDVVGMVGGNGVAECLAREVGVDFGGGYAFVTEHFLHSTEVGPVFDQFSGEAVAEGVRADMLVDAGGIDGVLQHDEHHLPCEVAAAPVEENIALLPFLGLDVGTDGENVGLQQVQCTRIDGYPALFVAFANDLQALVVGIDVGQFQVDKLGDAESAAVEDFDDDVVARRFGQREVEGGLDLGDFVVGKHIGQVLRACGKVDVFGWVVGYCVFDDEHVEKPAPTFDDAALGVGLDAGIGHLLQQLQQIIPFDGFGLGLMLLHVTGHVVEVAEVGLDTVAGHTTFEAEIGLKAATVALPGYFCFLYHL